MQNQSIGWLKLAMISFIGIIIGLMLLSFIAPYGANGISMGMGSGGDPMVNSSAGNMASHTSSNSMGSMNHSSASMNNMGSMNTPTVQANGNAANLNSMMQTLNQMQMQINQMQQQIMLNPGNFQLQNVPQNGMNSGGAMPGGTSGGSSGGMM